MPTTIEYLLNDAGRAYKRTIDTRELNLNGLTESLTGNIITRIPKLMTTGWGQVGLAIHGNAYRFTVHLEKLRLKIPCRALDSGVLYPDFTSGANLPVISLDWYPSGTWGMKLKLMVMFAWEEGLQQFVFQIEYLIAEDKNKATYRLPLPNLYEDLHVCTGKNAVARPVLGDALRDSMEAFDASQWNDHLWHYPTECQQFFRWKPLKDGFETLYPDPKDWQRYCIKAGVQELTTYLL